MLALVMEMVIKQNWKDGYRNSLFSIASHSYLNSVHTTSKLLIAVSKDL